VVSGFLPLARARLFSTMMNSLLMMEDNVAVSDGDVGIFQMAIIHRTGDGRNIVSGYGFGAGIASKL
jgi:hypothetical protein